ncbi:phage baseplate upper protein [Listeria innocua]|uniref:phage baseplate upper protein n=2 Tax=Listeria innocua TaxID=1642 RepID=UPI0021AB2A2B|nr:phage baseplate upper protein [Listeria innocua]
MSALRKIYATLDLNRKTWNIERIEAIQGDIDSLMIAVQIVENGKQKNLIDYKPTFAVVLPGTVNYVIDDLHFSNEKMNEGYFEYTFVKEAFSVPGVYDTARFILQNEDGTELSGMPRFTYYVEKDPLQGKVVAESYISDFERLEQMIHAVELEIAELNEKINIETSKLQSEADDLQQQFDNLNPTQFAQKTALDEHVDDSDIHVTATDKINWNAKETVEGAQEKADKALSDAKIDSQDKANKALADANAYTDSYFNEYVAFEGAVYLVETQTYTWDVSKLKTGVYIEVSRYNPGTGVYEYGFDEIFYSKSFIENHVGKAVWRSMPGSTDNARKEFKFTTTSLTGYAANSIAPNNNYAVRKIRVL